MTKIEGSAYRRALAFGSLLAAFLAASLLVSSPAHAKTFIVDNATDFPDPNPGDGVCVVSIFGGCSLRAAIQEANFTAVADTINFNISGAGPHTISPTSPLPQIAGTLSIDGYSQPDSSPNTNPDLAQGTNAAPTIELDGAGIAEPTTGLLIKSTAPNSVVRGLVIDRFNGSGIIVEPGGSGNRIEGNFIGIGGNDGTGVGIGGLTGGSNTVGGVTPDVRNVISANGGVGVSVGSSGNKVQGNYIGTTGDLASARGNSLAGVSTGHFGNTVGGTDANSANVIAFNGEDGVRVVNNDSTGNRILSNTIFSNAELGIDLRPTGSPGGPTPNDTLDPDTGPNNLQNFPDLASATLSGGQLTVAGNLNTNPSTFVRGKKKKKIKKKPKNVFVPQSFTVQFFSNPSGQNEGKALVGQTTLVTNLFGDTPIDLTFTPSRAVSAGEQITATATRNATGDTSEFSSAVRVS